mmetsp:Transcript_25731/g.65472  ORF Transcript_25731/g.65472 Transcript_25731/m.65472 type:complete len:250 (-) Transcript_25731:750-1499(-)
MSSLGGRRSRSRCCMLLGARRLLGCQLASLRAEDGPLLRVLLVQHRRRAEVLAELLVALEARIAHSRSLALRIAQELAPEAALNHHKELVHVMGRDQVKERKASRDVTMLLARHVEEGIPVSEATTLQELQELLPGTRPSQVPDHDRGTLVLTHLDLLWVDVIFREVFGGDLRAHGAVALGLGLVTVSRGSGGRRRERLLDRSRRARHGSLRQRCRALGGRHGGSRHGHPLGRWRPRQGPCRQRRHATR